MRDLHLLRALKEGGHKWNPGVKCDSRGAALEGDIVPHFGLFGSLMRRTVEDVMTEAVVHVEPAAP